MPLVKPTRALIAAVLNVPVPVMDTTPALPPNWFSVKIDLPPLAVTAPVIVRFTPTIVTLPACVPRASAAALFGLVSIVPVTVTFPSEAILILPLFVF